ncbi:type IV pilus twitching motility protein PilT [Facilibium subflavum]|uniref:type IV pilus twitching motility protein PilT n=1 Tax=Facilibium subflavum TaxID=2219058 RepID=UPI0013C2C574|nr:ATPase, T2SS/T4P/T4SS family [Facilibium subflavum]
MALPKVFSHEPPYFVQSHFIALLRFAHVHHCSDLTFQPHCPVMAFQYGSQYPLTQRLLLRNEVEDFLNFIYGSNAVAKVLSGTDLDFSYSHNDDNNNIMRFRVNATLGFHQDHLILQISLRVMPETIPLLDSLDIPDDIIPLSQIKDGIVMVCGATGSGKSTLLASMMLERASSSHQGEKIITYESPIEYLLPAYINQSNIIQTELPRCLSNYAYAVRNALRRTPTAIMLGEARDSETISAVIEASLTGHAIYTTMHSQSVLETVNRLLMMFNTYEKARIQYDFFMSIRAIIWQKLLPSAEGKRTALREYLIFDQPLKQALVEKNANVAALLNQALHQKGTTRLQHLETLYQKNIISENTYREHHHE